VAPSLSPLAEHLRANLATLMRTPAFAKTFPSNVASILEENPQSGVVFLLDKSEQVLGYIEAHRDQGVIVKGKFIYVSYDHAADDGAPFALDLARQTAQRSAALTAPPAVQAAAEPSPATQPRNGRRR
jgi:hypothetical protein